MYLFFLRTIPSLSQDLLVDEAWKLLSDMETKFKLPKSAPALVALATASAVMGNVDSSKNALSQCEIALKSFVMHDGKGVLDCDDDVEDNGGDNEDGSERKDANFGSTSNTQRSAPLFLRLRQQEIERECHRVKEYVQCLTTGTIEKHLLKPLPNGLTEVQKVITYPSRERGGKGAEMAGSSTIDFGKVFGSAFPLRLEVCSGHGDWISARAAADKKINWVGLEMRYERVYQIWSKAMMNRQENLAILHGEAHGILENCIKSGTFTEVFVNFPDPPVWGGSTFRLVDTSFLTSVHRILSVNGSITCVTDDSGYALAMVKEFHKPEVQGLFKSAFGNDSLMLGLPADYGSSYFDRFWQNGNKKQRFCLTYIKI